jgi:hypothetical protein
MDGFVQDTWDIYHRKWDDQWNWLVVTGTWLLYDFPLLLGMECHHPIWRTPWFFRGVGIPPTRWDKREKEASIKPNQIQGYSLISQSCFLTLSVCWVNNPNYVWIVKIGRKKHVFFCQLKVIYQPLRFSPGICTLLSWYTIISIAHKVSSDSLLKAFCWFWIPSGYLT